MTFLRTSTVVTWKPSAAQAGARTMTILPPGVFVYLHIYVFAYLCICVFAYLSICEFVYLRMCVFVYLRICEFAYVCICKPSSFFHKTLPGGTIGTPSLTMRRVPTTALALQSVDLNQKVPLLYRWYGATM